MLFYSQSVFCEFLLAPHSVLKIKGIVWRRAALTFTEYRGGNQGLTLG